MRAQDAILADSADRKLRTGRQQDITEAEADAYIRRAIAIPSSTPIKQAKAA